MIEQLPDLPDDVEEQLLGGETLPGWAETVGPMLSMYRGEQERRTLIQRTEVWLAAEKQWKNAHPEETDA